MPATVLKLRLDEDLKKQANELAKSMGFTISDAVRMFLIAFVDEQRIPFALEKPNRETIKAMQDVEKGNTLKCDSFTTLLNEVDKEIAEECSPSK